MQNQSRISARIFPVTVLGRIVIALIAATLAVVGLFFVAFALVAAAIVAAIVAIRIWWVMRKIRAQRDDGVIEGTYSTEPDQALSDDSHQATKERANEPLMK
jgi:predicted lipid-binding transport protein (Tim44 family)